MECGALLSELGVLEGLEEGLGTVGPPLLTHRLERVKKQVPSVFPPVEKLLQ